METYSTVVLLGAALILVLTLFFLRRRLKQSQEPLLEPRPDDQDYQQIELIRVQNPTEQDLQAYTLIEAERQSVWRSLSTKTSLAPRKIYELSFDLIRRIAGIYYPDIETPEFQASIFDLLELNYRIIERVKEYLEEFPLNTIKDVNIQDILKYKRYYDRFSQVEIVKFAKEHQYLYTVGRYLWMGYNTLNPWYWGQRAVLTAGREGAFRYLLAVIITVVGEEAVLVYSRRNIRAKAVAIEKQIALEMINMALADGVVSREEYDVILNFILTNPRLDDQVKVTLLKALARKRSMKPAVLPDDIYAPNDKKRLLTEVERVAKADKLGLLKKRAALQALEQSLQLTSGYRTQLELAPFAEVHSRDQMQQKRQREAAILRLMIQAGALDGVIPASLREYIVQRAVSYPLPFNDEEQAGILEEAAQPTAPDTLTNAITTNTDKERALTDVLDALLWVLPFTRKKEEFYTLIVSALGMQKIGDAILLKRLAHHLPAGDLIETPPAEVLKYLYRLLQQEERPVALQRTATTYTFLTGATQSKQKDTEFRLCVTTKRLLVLAATTIEGTIYQHHLEFPQDSIVRVETGILTDTYIVQKDTVTIRLDSVLFRSSQLREALRSYFSKKILDGEKK